jgi:addiction module HigA family antidote
MAKKLPPVHPGEILREEFLVPLKLTPYAVAAALHVPRTRIERLAREEKGSACSFQVDCRHCGIASLKPRSQ